MPLWNKLFLQGRNIVFYMLWICELNAADILISGNQIFFWLSRVLEPITRLFPFCLCVITDLAVLNRTLAGFFFLEHVGGELHIIVLIEEKRVIHRPKPTHTHYYMKTESPI
jgi:hypothetical protein